MRSVGSVSLSILLLLASSGAALAQARGGGGGRSAPSRPAPAARPAQSRPAPSRPAPSHGSQVTRPSNGFQLNHDVSKPNPSPARPAAGGGSTINKPGGGTNNRPGGGTINKPGGGTINKPGSGNTINKPTTGSGNTVNKPNINGNTINKGSGNTVNVNHNTNVVRPTNGAYAGRAVVVNPVYPYGGAAYGWNHGSPWYPAPNYYGGGFWGAMAISATSAAVYGSIVANNQTYKSYQVQSNSPGATLLNNYQLTQVQCGPSGLVVIYGPSNSVMCANPNNMVSAGNYDIDSQQLSLVSR
jgi:hypothetical protein